MHILTGKIDAGRVGGLCDLRDGIVYRNLNELEPKG